MSAQNLVAEIERLAGELRDRALSLLEAIRKSEINDDKVNRLLLSISIDGLKVVRVADILAVKCRKYLEKTRR